MSKEQATEKKERRFPLVFRAEGTIVGEVCSGIPFLKQNGWSVGSTVGREDGCCDSRDLPGGSENLRALHLGPAPFKPQLL